MKIKQAVKKIFKFTQICNNLNKKKSLFKGEIAA